MTDINALWGQAKAADANNFSKLPPGEYHGHIANIIEATINGKAVFKIMVEVDGGRTHEHLVWDISGADLEEVGEEKFLASVARAKRLVVDLGQPEPGTYDQWLAALGQCVGAECSLRVVASTKNPDKTISYLDGPSGAPLAGPGAAAGPGRLAKPKAAPQAASQLRKPSAGY